MSIPVAAVEIPGAEIALGPWSFCAAPPGACAEQALAQLCAAAPNWQPAPVPGTVASALRGLGQWDINAPLNADARDWWWRTSFAAPDRTSPQISTLCLDGLATHAEVWLNGRSILTSDNMFLAHRLDVTKNLKPQNELVICCRSLGKVLAQARPRPRWKTNLVDHQQLRWQRTTLLGRIPGWTPPVPPIGPWRAVRIEEGEIAVSQVHLTSHLEESVGAVQLRAEVISVEPLQHAILKVGTIQIPLAIQSQSSCMAISGTLRYTDAPLWWPHTHGDQPLLPCALELVAGGRRYRRDLGQIGFRRLEVDRADGCFVVKVNGVPVYCRGACWTVADIVTLDGSRATLERDLQLARAAGANMLRVGGTMIYESDAFYELCDQLGILVWQDFMFANMDYPVDDPSFLSSIETEAAEQLRRLAKHPSLAIYCGNSEVEQQAAMRGVPRELWRNRWFSERLPALAAELHPGTAYVPSTPSGGTMPFHVQSGITHYYGVGAYLRPISEVRRADVKFTPECLAFAHVPELETVQLAGWTQPRWKVRVPRDTGAGWDFEDVRDHYLAQLFGVDPVKLRSFDPDRYLRLSRVVTGEVMTQVFAEWRSDHSRNGGALVWFFKDLWPGAGWGILDSFGIPKAAYYYLKRCWQSRQVAITDEGLDGLHLHVSNESPHTLRGFVELLLLEDNHIVVARQETPCEVAPRSRCMCESDALLGGFHDVTYAYRFGPPKHDVTIATLYDHNHDVISEAFHFLRAREPAYLADAKIDAQAQVESDGTYQVTLTSDRFLQGASFDARGFQPSDSYFHLIPGRKKVVRFSRCADGAAKFRAYIEALNLREPVRIRESRQS